MTTEDQAVGRCNTMTNCQLVRNYRLARAKLLLNCRIRVRFPRARLGLGFLVLVLKAPLDNTVVASRALIGGRSSLEHR